MPNSLEQMIDVIEQQLLLSTFVTDPNNVYLGELQGKESWPDPFLPRLEYVIMEENNFEYGSQLLLLPVNWFSVSGFIRVPTTEGINDTALATKAKARAINFVNFFRETATNIFKINTLKLEATAGVDGLIQMHPVYHAELKHELVPFMDSFVFNFAMEGSRPYDRE